MHLEQITVAHDGKMHGMEKRAFFISSRKPRIHAAKCKRREGTTRACIEGKVVQ